MSVVEHPREVLGRRKKPFVFFFVIMVRNLNFICLVAEVVAFGIVSATCGVFSTHCSSSKAPVATASSEREMSSHLVGKLRGLSSWETAVPHSAEQPHGSASSEASVAKTQKQVRAPGPARVD